ncbi:MAG: hypothetical protein PH343_02820 [Nitrospira sp.]|nr:hypothetical protein [Nitrospira sp.]
MNGSNYRDISCLTYLLVWAGLIFLLFINIMVSRLYSGLFSLVANILIASVQSFLVLSFLMHLKSEKGVLRLIVPLTIIIFFILAGMIFSDAAFR